MVLTCTGVSFFHGSNDGQKGMGLIMLILIGTVPTAYALNHAVSPAEVQDFIAASDQAGQHPRSSRQPHAADPAPTPAAICHDYIRTNSCSPTPSSALRELVKQLNQEVALYKEFNAVPARSRPTFATTCTWRARPSADDQGRQSRLSTR